eukprot:COSAG02_NODE_11240_length_1763_cov_1.400841_2_plen_69_part_00
MLQNLVKKCQSYVGLGVIKKSGMMRIAMEATPVVGKNVSELFRVGLLGLGLAIPGYSDSVLSHFNLGT